MRANRILGLFCVCTAFLFAPAACPQDAAHPIRISVDLRDAPRYIFHARIEMPVHAGPMTLVYPKWIPGEHGPTGPISDLTGLHVRANSRDIAWKRDDVDMYAFHFDVPEGVHEIEASLDYLSPTEAGIQGVPDATPELAVLPWNVVMLYPQGTNTDNLIYAASLQIPSGWKYGTALRPVKQSGGIVEFAPVSLTNLVDSPVIAGAHMNTIDLSPDQKPEHYIHIAADSAAATQASPEEVRDMRQLVAETGALFGARHYEHYDFLLALTDYMSPNGLEHHQSSDNRVPERTLLASESFERAADLLPHEFFHSWNGKYRRPAGLATPNYQEPMKGDLLWVYEGLTEYYGTMLAARSGFLTPEQLHDSVAGKAAYLNNRPGRTWRDLQDTAIAAQLLYTARKEGSSWRRSVDYYNESLLIWLEADTIIRRLTNDKRSLDDFCRAFHGGESTRPKVVPYTFEDVVAALQKIAPYDWSKFFIERLTTHGPGAPLAGLQNSGWRLTYSSAMNVNQRADEVTNHFTDVQFSLGFIVHNPGSDDPGEIIDVIPGSPAALAGMVPGMHLLAVNGRSWTPDGLREAIRQAQGGSAPIELLVNNESYFHTLRVDYHGGEKYPHLERIADSPDLLNEIIRRKAPAVAAPAG
jgi:predicted metalloprotease with PDZ domain